MALMLTFSGFKLPHYLNIIFPATAVMTAAFLIERLDKRRNLRPFLLTQVILCSLCLVLAGVINVWAFPASNVVVIAGFFLLLLLSGFFLLRVRMPLPKLVFASVLTSAVVFYLLNANFYPKLLTYQAGNELAFDTKEKVDPKAVYFMPGIYSSSYNFYTAELRKEFHDSVLQRPGPIWLATVGPRVEEIRSMGLPVLQTYGHADYEITMLQLPFINPATRKGELTKMVLVRVK
jgi:4-amino-4-deoxy-L-arabinose transferase-like glycosyltransferase